MTRASNPFLPKRASLPAALAAAVCLGIVGCVLSEEKKQPEAKPVFAILSPAKGAGIKTTDTVVIVTRSDYTQFAGGIHISYSFDSSKTWTLIRSLAPKAGLYADTLRWYPADEAADPVVAGAKAMLKVTDYAKKHSAESEFLFVP